MACHLLDRKPLSGQVKTYFSDISPKYRSFSQANTLQKTVIKYIPFCSASNVLSKLSAERLNNRQLVGFFVMDVFVLSH